MEMSLTLKSLPLSSLADIKCRSLNRFRLVVNRFQWLQPLITWMTANKVVPIGEYKIYSEQNIQINKNQLKFRIRLDPNGVVVIHSVSVLVEGGNQSPKKNSNENQVIEDIDMNIEQNSSQSQPMETEDSSVGADTNNTSNHKDSGDQKEDKKSKKTQISCHWTTDRTDLDQREDDWQWDPEVSGNWVESDSGGQELEGRRRTQRMHWKSSYMNGETNWRAEGMTPSLRTKTNKCLWKSWEKGGMAVRTGRQWCGSQQKRIRRQTQQIEGWIQ